MKIGILEITLLLYEVNSLKEKRIILKSLIQKLKNRYNISISEISYNDVWKNAKIGIATISNSQSHLDSTLDHILDFIDTDGRMEMIDVKREVIL
jgi:Uncharacterized protein conserved in bacteria